MPVRTCIVLQPLRLGLLLMVRPLAENLFSQTTDTCDRALLGLIGRRDVAFSDFQQPQYVLFQLRVGAKGYSKLKVFFDMDASFRRLLPFLSTPTATSCPAL